LCVLEFLDIVKNAFYGSLAVLAGRAEIDKDRVHIVMQIFVRQATAAIHLQ
jgi:hypothetical protein